MRWKWVFLAPAFVLGIALFVAIGGEVVRLLWNWLLPSLFGWREITFWQALGLLALCRILFGGLGCHHGGGGGFRRRMAARFDRMTPEERVRFRERMRERWGCEPFSGGDTGGAG